jgi:hypothetical protein
MKFTSTTEINAPREKTVKLFLDSSRYKEWQDGFVSIQTLRGKPWEKGTQSLVIYKNGKMTIDLKETILESNLPEVIIGLYEHEHMVNTMVNRFTSIDHAKTQYETEIDYTKFVGAIPKLMALVGARSFQKQVQKRLDSFKNFAEKELIR